MSQASGKILVVYFHNLGFPIRKTNEQMIYCFERYSNHKVFFLNLAWSVPAYILQVNFDLVIFHDLMLCKRSLPRRFAHIRKTAQPLKHVKGYRIATVQDEFTQTKLLNQFLVEFEVKHIFSVAPPSEWTKIYPSIDRSQVKFDFCLTGYLDDQMIEDVNRIASQVPTRNIDIGYRASYLRHALGFIGYLKIKISEVFREATKASDLKVDISNDNKDTILGEDWYRFLLRCKYTLGVESGASVLDEDGSIEERVENYLRINPQANFEDVSANCLGDLDGKLRLQVIGPRHLEACVAKTCQILTEGDYNGILKPFVHYIPVKADFSNVEEVLEQVKSDSIRSTLVENAYNDIVRSGNYSFSHYVKQVLERSLGENYSWSRIEDFDLASYNRNVRREKRIWKYVKLRTNVVKMVLNLLPQKVFKKIEAFMRKQS